MERFNSTRLEKLEQNSNNKNSDKVKPVAHISWNQKMIGREFQLIMQQISLELPVENFFNTYPELKQWVELAKPFLEIPVDIPLTRSQ
jgi:hypothetical protein